MMLRSVILMVGGLLVFGDLSGRSLVKEQIGAYKKLLNTDNVTAEGLMTLIKLHDDDTVCVGPCAKYLENYIGKSKSLGWGYLEKFIEDVYGDMISTDPHDPQEVHLSLTGSPSSMKVMWATMENLENPFVEYTESSNDWSDANVLTSTASAYTYSVPHIFCVACGSADTQRWEIHFMLLHNLGLAFSYIFIV